MNVGFLCLGGRVGQWDGKTDSKIAGLQADDIGDRRQVAEGKGKEKGLHSSLS